MCSCFCRPNSSSRFSGGQKSVGPRARSPAPRRRPRSGSVWCGRATRSAAIARQTVRPGPRSAAPTSAWPRTPTSGSPSQATARTSRRPVPFQVSRWEIRRRWCRLRGRPRTSAVRRLPAPRLKAAERSPFRGLAPTFSTRRISFSSSTSRSAATRKSWRSVASLQAANSGSKAGLMIRADLTGLRRERRRCSRRAVRVVGRAGTAVGGRHDVIRRREALALLRVG